MIRPISVIVEPCEEHGYDVILITPDMRGLVVYDTRSKEHANYVCVALAWNQHISAQPAKPAAQIVASSP